MVAKSSNFLKKKVQKGNHQEILQKDQSHSWIPGIPETQQTHSIRHHTYHNSPSFDGHSILSISTNVPVYASVIYVNKIFAFSLSSFLSGWCFCFIRVLRVLIYDRLVWSHRVRLFWWARGSRSSPFFAFWTSLKMFDLIIMPISTFILVNLRIGIISKINAYNSHFIWNDSE